MEEVNNFFKINNYSLNKDLINDFFQFIDYILVAIDGEIDFKTMKSFSGDRHTLKDRLTELARSIRSTEATPFMGQLYYVPSVGIKPKNMKRIFQKSVFKLLKVHYKKLNIKVDQEVIDNLDISLQNVIIDVIGGVKKQNKVVNRKNIQKFLDSQNSSLAEMWGWVE